MRYSLGLFGAKKNFDTLQEMQDAIKELRIIANYGSNTQKGGEL